MAVPSYATDLSDIVTVWTEATPGWALQTEGGGGQNAITAPEVDDFIQGVSSVSRNPFSSSIRGIAYDNNATVAVTTDDAVFYWWKADIAQALDTKAAGGVHLTMGIGITDYMKHYIAGNDTYALGGWKCDPIDPNDGGDLDRGTPGSPDYDWFGICFDVPSTGPTKGFPFKIDMIRHGRSVDVTAGEVANPASWATLTTYADDITRRWGIVQETDTGAIQQGIVNWGTAAALVYSRDSGRAIVFKHTEFTVSDFTQLIFNNASSDVVWDSMSITALGTHNRGIITINNNAEVTITNSTITDIDTTADGGTNSIWDGTKWDGTNTVTTLGGSFLGCSILVPTVDAAASALVYNVATNPNGILDNMTFSKGTNDHHAIEFDATNAPTTMTLTEIDFTGFNSVDDNDDSALYFPSTTKSYTVNLVGCTGDISYKVGVGGSVTFVVDPVTLEFTVKDGFDGALLDNARVLVLPTSGVNFTYQASIDSGLTGSGTLITASQTAHGYATNDWVFIEGASPDDYNGVHQITKNTDDEFEYTIAATVTSSPATGTLLSTYAMIQGLTSSGVISDSWSLSSDQPFSYRVRKSTSSPLFVQASGSSTITTIVDKDITVQLARDE